VRSATFRPLPVGVEKMLCAPWVEGGMQGPMRFLREMVQEEGYGGVGRRSPTKIVWGNDDAWIPVEMAERLKKALNAEEMVVIAEAGHLVQYDQPGRLALEVGLWLSKHSEDEV
jgi:pimeloyl-ACP methyl ester carboxylesterase